MEENIKKAQPKTSEFKGKPVIQIPLIEEPSPDTTWQWLTFGKSKAK